MARRGENIYRRKDGRWEGRYKSGYTAGGKAKYRSVYGHTYAQVRAKLAPLKITQNAPDNTCRLTVKELFQEWLPAVRLRVKASTYANYQLKIEKHILPEFGKVRYDALTVQGVNSFVQKKLDAGLSAKYVSDIIIVFKTMAKYTAKVHEFRNILADVALPKVHKKEKTLLTGTQQRQLCRHLLKDRSLTAVCVLLSLYTGLRVGEVCGIMWSDIDLDKSILTVRRTVQRIKTDTHSTSVIAGTPKSLSSQRSIPVPGFIASILRKFRSADSNYLLSGSGNALEPRTLQRRFKSILKKAGLPSVSYHSLRHAFATNCLQAGFDVKTLSEILGHASVKTTLDRYVHTSMERKFSCMALLETPVYKACLPSELPSGSAEKTPVFCERVRL